MTTKESKWTRRDFLKKSGAGLLAVCTGGLLWRAADQGVFHTGKGPAYELWSAHPPDQLKGPLSIIRAAVLASNPHNTQPWLFHISPTAIELWADPSRALGSMDPYLREMHIGLGCAVENALLAAEARGYTARLTTANAADAPDFIARIVLSPGEKNVSPHYEAIPRRHTHRGEYDRDKGVSTDVLNAMSRLAEQSSSVKFTWLVTPEQKQQAGEWTVEATEAIIADQQMSDDSNVWYRDDWDDLQTKRDGLTLDAQGGPFWLRAAGKMLPPVSHETANRFWVNATRDTHTATTAVYGILSVRDFGSKADRLEVGRVWQRLHLEATVRGLAAHPLNQLMEMRDREWQLNAEPRFGPKLKRLETGAGWDVLFLFRMGYPLKDALPSPRRSLDEVTVQV